jgi:Uma2 family endonuclease
MSAATVPVSTWTEDEYFALGETRQRVELINGSLVVTPNPSPDHQDINVELVAKIKRALPSDLWCSLAVNVRLRRGIVVIPDAVISRGQRALFSEATDIRLVAEVVSPSNAATDRVLKMKLYAEARIPWYLLVEQDDSGIALRLHRLAGDHYALDQVAVGDEPLLLTEPVKVEIVPDRLLAG